LQQPGMDRRGPAAASSSSNAGGGASSSAAAGFQQQQQQQHAGSGKSPPCRAVGPALHAVLEYLVSITCGCSHHLS
jgi:hypothetical protein